MDALRRIPTEGGWPMGWLMDYLEKLSLIDYAASRLANQQADIQPMPHPHGRKKRKAMQAGQLRQRQEAAAKYEAEKLRREKVQAEKEAHDAFVHACLEDMRKMLYKKDDAGSHKGSNQ